MIERQHFRESIPEVVGLDDAVSRKHRLGFQSEDSHGDVTGYARPGQASCCGSSEIVKQLRAAVLTDDASAFAGRLTRQVHALDAPTFPVKHPWAYLAANALQSDGKSFGKWLIEKQDKRNLLFALRAANITASALFPGIDGVGRSLGEFVRICALLSTANAARKRPQEQKKQESMMKRAKKRAPAKKKASAKKKAPAKKTVPSSTAA